MKDPSIVFNKIMVIVMA